MAGSGSYILEVNAQILIKVAIKGSFRGNKKKHENIEFLGHISEVKTVEYD